MSAIPPKPIAEGVISPARDELEALSTEDVVEVPLLLSGAQMSALELAAHKRHLTAAEMARRALAAFIHQLAGPFPGAC